MKIAVYCASGEGKKETYRDAAAELGKWIGENGHTLVFGGGNIGLMGIVASEAFQHGANVIGVLPADVDFINNRPQPYCTEVIREKNMAARKDRMLHLADAFIALPGGIGTLDEVTEAIVLTRIHVFDKPVVLFNTEGFYEPFRQMLDTMIEAGFLTKDEKTLFSDDLNEISAFIQKT